MFACRGANIFLTEYEFSEKHVLESQSHFVSLFRNCILLFQCVVVTLSFGAGEYCWWELLSTPVSKGSLQILSFGIQLTLYERYFLCPPTWSQGKCLQSSFSRLCFGFCDLSTQHFVSLLLEILPKCCWGCTYLYSCSCFFFLNYIILSCQVGSTFSIPQCTSGSLAYPLKVPS